MKKKVKNLCVSYVRDNDIEKLIIVREPSKYEKSIRFLPEDLYFNVFTGTKYLLNRKNVSLLEMYLSIDEEKKKMSINELKEFYKKNSEKILKNIIIKPKQIMGFRDENSKENVENKINDDDSIIDYTSTIKIKKRKSK